MFSCWVVLRFSCWEADVKGNELVWRAIADAALQDERRWKNYGDLAYKAGAPASTAQLACRKLIDIGAIRPLPRGGFSTVSPEKVLTVLCAWRNLQRDQIAWTTRAGAERAASMDPSCAVGGAEAAIFHLGGKNTVADISTRILYVSHPEPLAPLPEGDEVLILRMDRRAALDWDGYSSPAQTYADLFASPGWQASEFRYAMRDKLFAGRDWDQKVLVK